MTDRLTPYLRAFAGKWRWMTNKEVEEYDEWYMYSGLQDYFREIAEDEGLNEKETQKFLDLMYKVVLAKGGFDERYDNVLIHDAIKRVKTKGR